MPVTKRGIYHNLKESKYTISNSEIVFFFSSELYLNKFMERYRNHREKFQENLEKHDVTLNMNTLADITLYKSIEKRGFRSCLNGLDVTYDDLNKYAIRNMTSEKTLDWERIERPNIKQRIMEME